MEHFEEAKIFLAQNHVFYTNGKKEIIEYLEQQFSIENKIEYLKEGIKKLIEFEIKNELEVHKNVPIDKRMTEIDVSGEAIKELKSFCEKLLEKHKELKDTEEPIIRTSKNKLKWLGSPSQFGHIFLELAEKGFIEIPSTNGEASYSKFSKVCSELFDFEKETTLGNLEKEMNPKKNTLSETVRAKIIIPEKKYISKK